MDATLTSCNQMVSQRQASGSAGHDFCITTADKALEGVWVVLGAPREHACLSRTAADLARLAALPFSDLPLTCIISMTPLLPPAAVRAGWRGQPLVVLGRREDLPLNLQPLATTVRCAG